MNKIALTAMVLGIVTGFGGASHGPGEMLQGNVAPKELVIQAWPSLIALNGEPAMTVLPSFMLAGILTIIVGGMIVGWAVKFTGHRFGGLVFIGLSVLLLLVGGGLIPPFIGIAAGVLVIVSNYRLAKEGGGNYE
jgi:hypothetical protein